MCLVVVGLLGSATSARAHVGSVPAKANFAHPAPIDPVQTDGGLLYRFVPEEGDALYQIEWSDGDIDPTGRFTFYYMDHAINSAVGWAEVEATATPIRDDSGRTANGIFVSCECIGLDAGATCSPTVSTRWCGNSIRWDTSVVASGVYWIIAVNHDPPFDVYNVSYAPVRVRHGGNPRPALLVLRPDGLLSADTSYRIAVVPVGIPPLTLDLWYGRSQPSIVPAVQPIVRSLPVTVGADGVMSYEWDVSSLPDDAYFVRAEVRDQNGSSYVDSRFSLAVYHPEVRPDLLSSVVDLGTSSDGSIIKEKTSGCSCSVASHGAEWERSLVSAVLIAALHRHRRGAKRAREADPRERPREVQSL